MVYRMFALGLTLLAMVGSSPVPGSRNPFTGTLKVNNENRKVEYTEVFEKLKENTGDGNYTIDAGADVRLKCQFTYDASMMWFLDWHHPDSKKMTTESNHWSEGYGDENVVSRDLYIKNIQPSDSGIYKCLRKKRRGSWDKETPIVINITVGK